MSIKIRRLNTKFYPDPKRVIAKIYIPGGDDRGEILIRKVLNLSDKKIKSVVSRILSEYAHRHRNISAVFMDHYRIVSRFLSRINVDPETLSSSQKLLIGAYFTHEYSIESAAFFNPSIVLDPNQNHLESGQKRVIISFRATGEGHISSIVFRSGIIDAENNLIVKPSSDLVERPDIVKMSEYNKAEYLRKLDELDIHKNIVNLIMDHLGNTFTYQELNNSIHETVKNISLSYSKKNVIKSMIWLADAHHEIRFSLDTSISERVIFPISDSEKNGIEDARFVRFTEDNGDIIYYATYTAYNGFAILPKILETKNFYNFTIRPLHGKAARNKGMALFPRKIGGKYVMMSRIDGYSNYIMYSKNLLTWQDALLLEEPVYPWEFVQIGNCGSPIETEHGWLLITHGVGPMREYCIGVSLLDLDHPDKVLCQLEEPILIPNNEEREGYVPNVVYSCGSIINNNELIVPYGLSDSASSFFTVELDGLFDALLKNVTKV